MRGLSVVRIASLSCAIALGACDTSAPSSDDKLPVSALDDGAYRFCHVEGANAESARRWCGLLEDLPPERCPGLRATCAGAVAEDPRGCSPSSPPGNSDNSDALAGEPQRPSREPMRCGGSPDLDSLESLLRWVAAIAVAVLVLVVLRLAWATFARWRPAAPVENTPSPAPVLDDHGQDSDIPDAPSGDLLDAARRALANGREAEAVLFARGAALRRLGELGRIWLHRSRTDREYVRSVRSDAVLYGELREICTVAESVRWKGSQIDAQKASVVLASAERLFAALLRTTVALFVLSACAVPLTDARAIGPSDQDYERYGPSGDAALLDLYRLYGYDASFRLTSLAALDDRIDVIVIDTTTVVPTDEQWQHIKDWVQDGGVLLVSGAPPALGELGQLISSSGTLHMNEELVSLLPLPHWAEPAWAFRGGQGWPLVADEAGNSIIEVLDLGSGAIVAVADPMLLWNASFVHPDNERFVGELFYVGQSVLGWPMAHPARIQLATQAATSSSDNSSSATNDMWGALVASGLLLFVIQLIATGILFSLWRGWPFSALRDPPDPGRHAFVEHVRALGTRYWRMQATAHVERQFATLWLLRLGVPGLQLAAQRAGYTPQQARCWAREVEAIATSSANKNQVERGDLGRMEELWRITRTAR